MYVLLRSRYVMSDNDDSKNSGNLERKHSVMCCWDVFLHSNFLLLLEAIKKKPSSYKKNFCRAKQETCHGAVQSTFDVTRSTVWGFPRRVLYY